MMATSRSPLTYVLIMAIVRSVLQVDFGRPGTSGIPALARPADNLGDVTDHLIGHFVGRSDAGPVEGQAGCQGQVQAVGGGLPLLEMVAAAHCDQDRP